MSSSQAPIVDRIRIIPRAGDFLDRNVGSSGEVFYNKETSTLRLYNGNDKGGYEVLTLKSTGGIDLPNVQKNKIRFHWDTLTDLQTEVDPTVYHGMIAHVHSEGRLYFAHAGAWVAVANLGEAGGGGGGASVDVSDTAPTDPQAGNIWFNSNSGRIYVYVEDGDSNQWVQPVVGPVVTSLLNLGITDGTQGQVLSTDGNGNFTFEDAGAGGVDLTAFSVGIEGAATDNGKIAYNNQTGVFTYSPPDFTALGDIAATSIETNSIESTGVGVPSFTSASSFSITAPDGVSISNDLTIGGSLLGITTVGATREKVIEASVIANVLTIDYEEGAVYFITTAPTADFTVNVTNAPTDNWHSMSLAILISQGGTAYMPATIQVNSVAQSALFYQGGPPAPGGTANGVDIYSLTLVKADASTYNCFISSTGYAS